MKYKIVKCGHPNGREGSGIIGGDIIELEPLDCPASESEDIGKEVMKSAGKECAERMANPIEYDFKELVKSKQKEIDDVIINAYKSKESLEDLFHSYLIGQHSIYPMDNAIELAQIVKEHYQLNPEELEN